MAKAAINKEEGSFEIRDLLFLCAWALKGRMSAKLTVPGAAGRERALPRPTGKKWAHKSEINENIDFKI